MFTSNKRKLKKKSVCDGPNRNKLIKYFEKLNNKKIRLHLKNSLDEDLPLFKGFYDPYW